MAEQLETSAHPPTSQRRLSPLSLESTEPLRTWQEPPPEACILTPNSETDALIKAVTYCEDGKAVHFMMHRSVATAQCPCFIRMLSHGFKEDVSSHVTFIEDSPESVAILLDYLYSREVAPLTEAPGYFASAYNEGATTFDYDGAWILADKILEGDLKNRLVNRFYKYYNEQLSPIQDLVLVVDKEVEEALMRKLCFDIVAAALRTREGATVEAFMVAVVEEGGVICLEVMKRLRRAEVRVNGGVCMYHDHPGVVQCAVVEAEEAARPRKRARRARRAREVPW